MYWTRALGLAAASPGRQGCALGPQGRLHAAGTCTLSLAHPVPLSSSYTGRRKEERGQEEQTRGYLGLQLAWIRKKLRLLLNIWLES